MTITPRWLAARRRPGREGGGGDVLGGAVRGGGRACGQAVDVAAGAAPDPDRRGGPGNAAGPCQHPPDLPNPETDMSPSHSRTRLTVIGAGYLGLTHAVCMAHLGHDVLALDVDENKVAMAAQGQAPFFEPGLTSEERRAAQECRYRCAP